MEVFNYYLGLVGYGMYFIVYSDWFKKLICDLERVNLRFFLRFCK